MYTIGVDCSMRSIGVVVVDRTGHVKLARTITPDPDLQLHERFHHLYKAIPLILKGFEKVDAVFFEGLAFGSKFGRLGDLGGAHHVARLSVYHWYLANGGHSLRLEDLASSHVRKHALGSAPPKGVKVKEWLAERAAQLGYPVFEDDHQLDAYLTALAGQVRMKYRKSIFVETEKVGGKKKKGVKSEAPLVKPVSKGKKSKQLGLPEIG